MRNDEEGHMIHQRRESSERERMTERERERMTEREEIRGGRLEAYILSSSCEPEFEVLFFPHIPPL